MNGKQSTINLMPFKISDIINIILISNRENDLQYFYIHPAVDTNHAYH